MSAGNYQSLVAVDRHDELGKLARAYNAMTKQVEKARADLEHRVIESGKMNEQLRELSAHLQNIREEERIHIAREMHDELGQLLTGFKMDVSWLHRKMSSTDDPAVKEKLEEMMEITNEAARFVRKLASELRPSILDDLGLVPALDWHSQEFSRRSNIAVNFQASSQDLKLPEGVATVLFRMYLESLTNVARHAHAKKVTARLEVNDDLVNLSIADDGKGFDSENMSGHKTLGLLGMHERAMMIGGTLEINSRPGNGTTVNISVPLHQSIITG
jgi:signal transduction histidine kinase